MSSKIPVGWWITAVLWGLFWAVVMVTCIALAFREVTS